MANLVCHTIIMLLHLFEPYTDTLDHLLEFLHIATSATMLLWHPLDGAALTSSPGTKSNLAAKSE